jgi:hypothetical protein
MPSGAVHTIFARSEAKKQSILSWLGDMDCFAALAMTENYANTPKFFAARQLRQ